MSNQSTHRPIRIGPRTFAMALGTLAALVGVLLLFLPVSATANDGQSVGCGSPAAGVSYHTLVNDSLLSGEQGRPPLPLPEVLAGMCSDARDSRGTVAWAALGVGILAVAGARFVRW